jgi:hypothetical protein
MNILIKDERVDILIGKEEKYNNSKIFNEGIINKIVLPLLSV